MTSQLSQDHGARFATLVQPIKDLAANWDIDIAESLGDYLEELDQLRITMDGGQTQLNFAEAALLIQGSTAVYSKKVEYLHQLVLKSLEFITQRKAKGEKTGSAGSKAAEASDKSYDEDFLLNFGDLSEPHDLLLDHLIEDGVNIDLPATQPTASNSGASFGGSRLSADSAMNKSRVSVSLMHSLLADSTGGGALKLLSSAHLDQSGALLLGAFRPSYFRPLAAALPLAGEASFGAHSAAHVAAPEEHAPPSPVFDHFDGDGGDFYAPPADDVDDHFDPAPPALDEATEPTPVALAKESARVGGGAPLVPRERFAMLDPHSVLPGARPAQRGRPFRIPSRSQLRRESDEPSRAATRRLFVRDAVPLDPIAALLFPDEAPPQKHKLPLRGLLEPALLPLLQLKRKLQRAKRLRDLREQRLQAPPVERSVLDECVWEQPAARTAAAEAPATDEALAFDGGDDGGAFYAADYGDEVGAADAPEPFDDEELLQQQSARIDEALQATAAADSALLDVDGLRGGASYELLCRQYLEGFQRGADAFARETQLSVRVASWTSRLEPLLQRQEEEAAFDIHAYSDAVLGDLARRSHAADAAPAEAEAEAVAFNDVAAGRSAGEVCRVFLACLQLANLGNVDLLRPGDEVAPSAAAEDASPFALRLLSADRLNRDLSAFQHAADAPLTDAAIAAAAPRPQPKGRAKAAPPSGRQTKKRTTRDATIDARDDDDGDGDEDASAAGDENRPLAPPTGATTVKPFAAPDPRRPLRGLSQRNANVVA